MANPQWFEAFRCELQHRKLPPRYVERLIQELTDHVNDLMEEDPRMEAPPSLELETRIGTPAQVADAATAEYRKLNFCGRHPIFTFVVLPVPLVLLIFAVSAAGLAGICASVDFVMQRLFGVADCVESVVRPVLMVPEAPWLVGFGIVIIPLTLAMVVVGKLARASGKSWRWLLLACMIFVVTAKILYVETAVSPIPGRSNIMLGLSLQSRPYRFYGAQLLQCLATVAIGGLFTWRLARKQSHRMAL